MSSRMGTTILENGDNKLPQIRIYWFNCEKSISEVSQCIFDIIATIPTCMPRIPKLNHVDNEQYHDTTATNYDTEFSMILNCVKI